MSGQIPATGLFTDSDGDPNIFQDSAKALLAFHIPHPGESGIRNNLRAQGFFGIDTGLAKTWQLSESQKLRFNWQIYNVTAASCLLYGEIESPVETHRRRHRLELPTGYVSIVLHAKDALWRMLLL